MPHTLGPAVPGTVGQAAEPLPRLPEREGKLIVSIIDRPRQICAVQRVNKMDGVVRLSSGEVL